MSVLGEEVSFDYKELNTRYRSDAAFNKMVNCFRQLITEYGLMPQEIRDGLWLAQFQISFEQIEVVIRTKEDWEKHYMALKLLKDTFVSDPEALKGILK